MNVLIYDESRSIAHLTRALSHGLGHRVSLAYDATEAGLKLQTHLFDSLVLGPSGAPRELAEILDGEFPDLPIVLAGVEREIAPVGRIAAALPQPLSPPRFSSAMERLRRKAPNVQDVPVEVIVGGDRILCRATKLVRHAMLLEGPLDDRSPIVAELGDSLVSGEVVFSDWAPDRLTRRLGVRLLPC